MHTVKTLMDTFSSVILLNMLSIFLSLVQINAVKAEGSYISDSYSSWTEKETVCTVAVPPVKYGPEGISVEIEDTLAIDKDGAWVGYSEILTSFDYIGCFNETSLQKAYMIKSELGNVGSPGQCFTACADGTLIGISQKQCICLREIKNTGKRTTTLAHCDRKCVYQQGIACGGLTDNADRLISVYRSNSAANSVDDGDRGMFCLQLEPVKKQFSWNNCTLYLRNLCAFSADEDGIYLPDSLPENFYTWMKNANMCYKNRGLPLPFQNYSNATLIGTSQVWTNVIRSPVIRSVEYEEKHEGPATETGVRHGLVQMQNGTYWLKFTNDFTANKSILCQRIKTSGPRLGSDVSVLVGAPIAVVLVIVVVIIIFVLKRRNKIPNSCNRASKSREPEHPQTGVASHNPGYDQVGDILPENRADKIDSGQTQDNHAHTFSVLEKRENEYEQVNPINVEIVSENSVDNVYNKQNPESNVTYDTACNTTRSVTPKCDNMYDTRETVIAKLKDDKTPGLTCDTEIDTYNHIDSINTSQTDNVYNKLNLKDI